MNCNHDVPVSAACIIRELEHRGWELTKAQTLNGDNWEDILFTLVPELRTMYGSIRQRRLKRQEMTPLWP